MLIGARGSKSTKARTTNALAVVSDIEQTEKQQISNGHHAASHPMEASSYTRKGLLVAEYYRLLPASATLPPDIRHLLTLILSSWLTARAQPIDLLQQQLPPQQP